MDLDRDLVLFEEYVKDNYDINNPLITMKYIHTLMVVRIMSMLCQKMKLNEEDTKLALYIAVFHDLGRFKEAIRQNEFNNLKFDHGAYSNKILFNDGFISNFDINENDYLLIKKAVYFHNKKDLVDGLSEKERLFVNFALRCCQTSILPDFLALHFLHNGVLYVWRIMKSNDIRRKLMSIREISAEEIYEKLQPGVLFDEYTMQRHTTSLIELNKQRRERDNISASLVRTF